MNGWKKGVFLERVKNHLGLLNRLPLAVVALLHFPSLS